MATSIGRLLVIAACVVGLAGRAYGAHAGKVPEPPSEGAGPSAESLYNRGEGLAKKQDWKGAEAAYRQATTLKPGFPEAWNGLGHSLKMLGRYDDAVAAYQEALRLRPNFPQALEYLGETYVRMGRTDDAKKILAKLQPLDKKQADDLARAIDSGAPSNAGW